MLYWGIFTCGYLIGVFLTLSLLRSNSVRTENRSGLDKSNRLIGFGTTPKSVNSDLKGSWTIFTQLTQITTTTDK